MGCDESGPLRSRRRPCRHDFAERRHPEFTGGNSKGRPGTCSSAAGGAASSGQSPASPLVYSDRFIPSRLGSSLETGFCLLSEAQRSQGNGATNSAAGAAVTAALAADPRGLWPMRPDPADTGRRPTQQAEAAADIEALAWHYKPSTSGRRTAGA